MDGVMVSKPAWTAPLAILFTLSCGRSDAPLGAGFADAFERGELGADWFDSGGAYRIEKGGLVLGRAHNHPLWLRRVLPHDVRVELDASTESPDGDIKVELFGDGKSHQSDEAVRKDLIYTASGYVFIFGGWKNSRSVLVKQNEHAWQNDPAVPIRTTPRVEPGKKYHFAIERKGTHLDWKIDGAPFLSWDDPDPLSGPGHDHFAFDGWESSTRFDDLQITPL
jgi:hypothetical protein